MTTYKYKGVSPDGARVSGVIKAYDEFEAVSQLRETCSVVTKIEAVPEQKEGGVSFGSRRIKDKELAILCSQFAIILTSGLPIDRCVEMVAAQARSREIQRVLEHVAEDVSGGYSLAQSFTNAGTAFPVTFVETIRAGEQSGTLELCFDRLHKYYDKSAKTHAKLVSTLTYPVLVLIVAAIVFMVIMLFAVPMFTSAFAELGSDLPPITRGLIAVSNFFLHYWWIFVLMILAFCIVRLLLRRSDRGRMFLAAGKLKRSPLKRLHQINASAQFASTMATMLAAGLPVTRSLEVTAGVINNYLFSDSVRRVRQGVEQGRDLAGCMAADPTFPRLLTEMTGVGERSGNMEQTLTVIGDYFDNEVSVTTQRLLSLMEMLIVVAIIAVLIAIAIPTFTASLNKAKVATDEANIRAGYASAMAELIAGNTDVADGATLYLQKDGSVAATGTNDYTCQGKPGADVEIAGQSVAAWDKGHKVVYTFDAAANHFAISTAE